MNNSNLKPQTSNLLASLLFITAVGLPPLLMPPTTVISSYLQRYGPSVRIVFGGDIMLARGVDAVMRREGDDYPFAAISDTIRGADFAVANLESTLTDQPTPAQPDERWINLKARPATASALARAGFDLLTVANNHALDYGAAGLRDTVAALDAAGLRHVGTDSQPSFVTIKGLRLALLGYDCVNTSVPPAGTSLAALNCGGPQVGATIARVQADIRAARAQADAVIVMMHWGIEYQPTPLDAQPELAQAMSDAGATLIVGAHPHIAQGLAMVGGAVVAYSLGNFVFDTRQPSVAGTGMLLAVTLDRRGVAAAMMRPLHTYLQTRRLDVDDPHAVAATAAAARSSDPAMRWLTVSPRPPRDLSTPPSAAAVPTPTLALAYQRVEQPDVALADLNGDGADEAMALHDGSLSIYQSGGDGEWQPQWSSGARVQVRQFALMPRLGDYPAVIYNLWQPDYRWGGNGALKNQLCIVGWQPRQRQWAAAICLRPLASLAQRISVLDDATGQTSFLAVLPGADPAQAAMSIWSWDGFGYAQEWQSATHGYTRLFADPATHRFWYQLFTSVGAERRSPPSRTPAAGRGQVSALT